MDLHPAELGEALRPRDESVGSKARQRVLAGLSAGRIFAGFTATELSDLAAGCSLLQVPRRRRIYGCGEDVACMYVVAAGRVRVLRGMADVRTLTVAYRGVGEIVGEIAVTERSVHEDTATAVDAVELVQIPARRVCELLTANAELARGLLLLMVERRLVTERRIESLLSRSVESRVAEFLLDTAQQHGIPESRGTMIGVSYTHQEIADYVGSTRETVTLTLGELRRKDLVVIDQRRIVLREVDALTRMAQARC